MWLATVPELHLDPYFNWWWSYFLLAIPYKAPERAVTEAEGGEATSTTKATHRQAPHKHIHPYAGVMRHDLAYPLPIEVTQGFILS
jgi:hypothetical protein